MLAVAGALLASRDGGGPCRRQPSTGLAGSRGRGTRYRAWRVTAPTYDYNIRAKVAADPLARDPALFVPGRTFLGEIPASAQSSFAVFSSMSGARL